MAFSIQKITDMGFIGTLIGIETVLLGFSWYLTGFAENAPRTVRVAGIWFDPASIIVAGVGVLLLFWALGHRFGYLARYYSSYDMETGQLTGGGPVKRLVNRFTRTARADSAPAAGEPRFIHFFVPLLYSVGILVWAAYGLMIGARLPAGPAEWVQSGVFAITWIGASATGAWAVSKSEAMQELM